MELLDSRCGDCERKLCQCSACARKDSQTKLNAKKEAAQRRKAPAPAPVAASSAPSFSSSSDDEDQPEAEPYEEALQPMQRVYLAALNVVPNRELDPTLDQPPIAVAGAHAPAPAPSAAVASVNSAVKTLKDSAKAKYLTATVFEQGRKVFVPPAIGRNSGKSCIHHTED